MDAFLQYLLAGSHGLVAYGTVFGILVACGLGVPLPEDISLILGGYLAHQGAASLPVMMAVGFFGILVGDSLIYLVGRRVGQAGGRSGGFIARVVTPEKRARVEQMFERHGRKVVMIARFMPGVRAVTYFTAGNVRMSYWQFIFWDGLAALASAPLFVYLGFRFGGELDALVSRVKDGQLVIFGTLAVLGAAWFLLRRFRARRAAAALVAAPPMPGLDALAESAMPERTTLPSPVAAAIPTPVPVVAVSETTAFPHREALHSER